MWTPATRRQHSREGLRYETDLTDAEWAVVEPLLPPRPKQNGSRLPRGGPTMADIGAEFYPGRITAQVTPMPLCGTCHGCGLEFAFPPVAAGEMGGWTASWPHGREDGLVYRQTCPGCHGLGVTDPAANRPLSLQQVEHAEGLVQRATWPQRRPLSWARHHSVWASLVALLFG